MILFENVTKKYRGTQKPALDGIDLKIDRGEFVFIVGASGSGKSSCLRLILREDQPSSGKIHVAGQDLSKISSRKVPYFRRGLGNVFQDFRLLANKTVFDNVAFTLQVIGKSRGFIQEAVPDTLEMVGLSGKEKRFPHELSGGEQQRVAIARAIVNKPAILLADEPTGNLDPATSLGIMQLLKAINASGTTVVMATHEATFVDIMQQRVVELSQGVVVRDEVGGGYGQTASIPIAELTEEGARVLRTTESVVRQALSPEGEQIRIDDAPAAQAETDGVVPKAVVPKAVVPDAVVPTAVDTLPEELPSAAADLAQPANAEPEAVIPAHDEVAKTAAEAPAVTEVPVETLAPATQDAAVAADEFALDQTIRVAPEPEAVPGKRIPAFLDTEESPVEIAEAGGFAERLGLSDRDDQGSVGPVR